MIKLYRKSEIWFAVIWIIAYCCLFSVGDRLSELIGIQKLVTAPLGILLSVLLFGFIRRNGLLKEYGLCKSEIPAIKLLYYLPLVIILSINLWYGVTLNLSVIETVLFIISMLSVGFLEEVIFRGLLFKAMSKDNIKSAIIVSSITFGIGHIINLLNGSGDALLSNLLQVCYATAIGFLFVILFYKTKSLLVPIIVHGVFNSLSVFSSGTSATVTAEIISSAVLIIIPILYSVYINKTIRKGEDTR